MHFWTICNQNKKKLMENILYFFFKPSLMYWGLGWWRDTNLLVDCDQLQVIINIPASPGVIHSPHWDMLQRQQRKLYDLNIPGWLTVIYRVIHRWSSTGCSWSSLHITAGQEPQHLCLWYNDDQLNRIEKHFLHFLLDWWGHQLTLLTTTRSRWWFDFDQSQILVLSFND